MLKAIWDHSQLKDRFRHARKFVLEISRDNILEESLQKIVNRKPADGQDPLLLPLSVQFANEPAIDEGGVRREYFQLVIQELLNPNYMMFLYNEDV